MNEMWKEGKFVEATNIDTFMYRSSKYRKIINEIELKEACVEYLTSEDIPFDETEMEPLNTITLLAKYMIKEKKVAIDKFNNIFANTMTYTCSNIFLEKIEQDITDEKIESCFANLIENVNKLAVTVDQYERMEKTGFNMLDFVATREQNKLIFPVLEYDSEKIKMMCIIDYYNSSVSEYKVCTVEISRTAKSVTFFINGSTGSFKIINANNELITSPTSFFQFIKGFVGKRLNLKYESRNTKYQEEREKIYIFCNKLNQGMLSDFSAELDLALKKVLNNQITRIVTRLRKINPRVTLNKDSREDVYRKIFDTYLGQFITSGFTEVDLKEKALENGLSCYPTNISFTGQELAKGKARARKKEVPLAFEKVFFSLNADLENAKKLEEVTIAWFDSNFFKHRKETDVSQTTITINKNYFRITMKNTVNKNKRMTEFVEKRIREILD